MKTAVIVTKCVQIGIDTWRDVSRTKVFDETATLKKIQEWVHTIDKSASLSAVQFSDIDE